MFSIKSSPVPRTDHGRSGEGLESIVPHLQRRVAQWADTCPGSYDSLWNRELQSQQGSADDAFPPTLTMALSDF